MPYETTVCVTPQDALRLKRWVVAGNFGHFVQLHLMYADDASLMGVGDGARGSTLYCILTGATWLLPYQAQSSVPPQASVAVQTHFGGTGLRKSVKAKLPAFVGRGHVGSGRRGKLTGLPQGDLRGWDRASQLACEGFRSKACLGKGKGSPVCDRFAWELANIAL